jgi:hypothetical protein
VIAVLCDHDTVRGRRECLSYLLGHEDCVIIDEQQVRHEPLARLLLHVSHETSHRREQDGLCDHGNLLLGRNTESDLRPGCQKTGALRGVITHRALHPIATSLDDRGTRADIGLAERDSGENQVRALLRLPDIIVEISFDHTAKIARMAAYRIARRRCCADRSVASETASFRGICEGDRDHCVPALRPVGRESQLRGTARRPAPGVAGRPDHRVPRGRRGTPWRGTGEAILPVRENAISRVPIIQAIILLWIMSGYLLAGTAGARPVGALG